MNRARRAVAAAVQLVILALVAAATLAVPASAWAEGAVARSDIAANILDDGSLVVTDERTFVLTSDIAFVAWEIPTFGVEGTEILGFEGPGGAYSRVESKPGGGRQQLRTYYVEEGENSLIVYAWFRPRDGSASFTVWYQVPDAISQWGGSAGIYGRLSTSTQAEGVRGIRLVYSEQVTVPQEPRTNALLARVQPWIEEPPDVVERFSTWFALVVALFVLIMLLLVVWRRRRWYATSFVGSPDATVPYGLSPALASALLSGRTRYRTGLAATALDLVDRGIVSVATGGGASGRLRLSIDRSSALALERHERVARRIVFFWLGWLGSYSVPTTLRLVDRIKAAAVAAAGAIGFGIALRGQLHTHGLASRFTPGRVVLVISMGVLVIASGVPALFIAGSIPVFAINCLIGAAVPVVWLVPLRLTDAGVVERNRYSAFAGCLKDEACADGLATFQYADWRRAFALAVAFGCADSLSPATDLPSEPDVPEPGSLVAVANALAPPRRRQV